RELPLGKGRSTLDNHVHHLGIDVAEGSFSEELLIDLQDVMQEKLAVSRVHPLAGHFFLRTGVDSVGQHRDDQRSQATCRAYASWHRLCEEVISRCCRSIG